MSNDINEQAIKGLRPFRDEIDAIDDQILELLRKRFKVVDNVITHKSRYKIAASLQDRVDAVHDRNVATASKLGVPKDLVSALYTVIIRETCAYEAKRMGHDDRAEARIPTNAAKIEAA